MKIKISYDEIEDLFVNQKYNMSEISRMHVIAVSHVHRILKKRGVDTKSRGAERKFTNEQIEEIILLRMDRVSITKIAKIFKTYPIVIEKVLKQNNIVQTTKFNKYDFNHEFFSEIKTKAQATLLGLFYSDGYNCEKHGYVSLKLGAIDLDTIENVKNILQSNHKIGFSKISGENRQDQYRIIFHNRKFSSDLARLGCVQRKSLIKKFPKLESSELIKSFIYGYFLGNGWITYDKENGLRQYDFGIISTEDVVQGIKRFLAKNNINCSISRVKANDNYPLKQLAVGGNIKIVHFLNWLFTDELQIMKRKYNLYLEAISYLANPIREL